MKASLHINHKLAFLKCQLDQFPGCHQLWSNTSSKPALSSGWLEFWNKVCYSYIANFARIFKSVTAATGCCCCRFFFVSTIANKLSSFDISGYLSLHGVCYFQERSWCDFRRLCWVKFSSLPATTTGSRFKSLAIEVLLCWCWWLGFLLHH